LEACNLPFRLIAIEIQMSELELLRSIVGHIVVGPPFIMSDHENFMSRGFNQLTKQGYGLRREARTDLFRLGKCWFESSASFKRTVTYKEFCSYLTGRILQENLTKKPQEIGNTELQNLKTAMNEWVVGEKIPRQVFIPCILNTYAAATFSVGPVRFDFIDNFKPPASTPDFDPFPDIMVRMRHELALWMATVSLPGCSDSYGYELANLCVDLAISGLQLVIPLHHSKFMCRMDSKRSANTEILATRANGNIGLSRSTKNMGLLLSPGDMEEYIAGSPRMLPSCGNRIRAYLSGSDVALKLEMAWCDAAYWFHEGIAEPIDSIATCKLETALEALLRGVSEKNIRPLLKRTMRFAFEIGENEHIFTNPIIIAKDFVEEVVEIRSRILHGTLSTLDTETADMRFLLEKFVGIILQVYTLELDKYVQYPNSEDNLSSFFEWSEAQRRENPNSRFSTGWTGEAA
jgi:hypothetical protein